MRANPRRWTLLGAAIVGLTVAGVFVGRARAADEPKRVTEAGDSGIAQTRTAVQPLAVINGPANQGIDAVAGALATAEIDADDPGSKSDLRPGGGGQ